MYTVIKNNIDYKLQGQVRLTVNEGDKIIRDTGYINNLRVNSGIHQNKKFYNFPLDKIFVSVLEFKYIPLAITFVLAVEEKFNPPKL